MRTTNITGTMNSAANPGYVTAVRSLYTAKAPFFTIQDESTFADVILKLFITFFTLKKESDINKFLNTHVHTWLRTIIAIPPNSNIESYPEAMLLLVLMYVLNIEMPCNEIEKVLHRQFDTVHLSFVNQLRKDNAIHKFCKLDSLNMNWPHGVFENVSAFHEPYLLGAKECLAHIDLRMQVIRNSILLQAQVEESKLDHEKLSKSLGFKCKPGILDFVFGLFEDTRLVMYWLSRLDVGNTWDTAKNKLAVYKMAFGKLNMSKMERKVEIVKARWEADAVKQWKVGTTETNQEEYRVKNNSWLLCRSVFWLILLLLLTLFRPGKFLIHDPQWCTPTSAMYYVGAYAWNSVTGYFTVKPSNTTFWNLDWAPQNLKNLSRTIRITYDKLYPAAVNEKEAGECTKNEVDLTMENGMFNTST